MVEVTYIVDEFSAKFIVEINGKVIASDHSLGKLKESFIKEIEEKFNRAVEKQLKKYTYEVEDVRNYIEERR